MTDLLVWEQDKALYLFTSLTAGSSHIVTATSRIETILRASRIPFTYIDTATNESAKKLFQRRGRGRKLPFLVKEGFIIADLDEVEELNEFGELEDTIGEVETTTTSITTTPAKIGPMGLTGKPSRPALVDASSFSSDASPLTDPQSGIEPQHNSIMGQLAQESAGKARLMGKKSNLSLRSINFQENVPPSPLPKMPDMPPTPSRVPLPSSPAIKSPTVSEGIKSPTGSVSHHRHSSTGSAHSFIPEKHEPAPLEHRGSEISIASEEEIKRIEAESSIAEEDEGEEEEEATVSGDGKEDVKDTPIETSLPAVKEEAEEPKTVTKEEPEHTPVEEVKEAKMTEEEEDALLFGDDEDREETPKDQVVESLTSAATDTKAHEVDAKEVLKKAPTTAEPVLDPMPQEKVALPAASKATSEDTPAPKTTPAAVSTPAAAEKEPTTTSATTSTPTASSTSTGATLPSEVENSKIQDQNAAEGAQATISVED